MIALKKLVVWTSAGALCLGMASLTGCAVDPQFTKADNPLAELAPSAPRAGRVCVFFNENSKTSFDVMGDLHAALRREGIQSDADPRRRVSDLTAALTTRFESAQVIDSLEQVGIQKCDFALAMDIQVRLGQMSFATTTVEIVGAFADGQGRQIESLTASGRAPVPFPANSSHIPAAWRQAMDALLTGVDRSSAMRKHLAALRPGTASTLPALAAASSSPSVEIAFWESIKASTDPSDFAAYLRRFPSGAFESLARTRLSALGEPAPARLPALSPAEAGRLNLGRYHALVIGINNYRSVTPLKTALSDARAVAALLENEYGFSVRLLLDPNRRQMLDAFDDVRRTMTESDNLLIYYAGHGHLDRDSDRGFWLPVDAEADRRANWVSNSDVADFVRATRAKHVLVVADSCYAGTLTRNLSVEVSKLDDFSRLAQKRARTALVSGGLEPVEDAGGGGHSVFARAFLDALQSNTGIIDMSQMFSAMRRQVLLRAQQTPQYSDIRQVGHDGGDFIFARRR